MPDDSHAPATSNDMIPDEAVIDAVTSYRERRKAGLLANPGRVSSELVESLKVAFPPEVIHAHIASCMVATVVTRGGTELPDNRTRLAALQLLLAYTEGRPVERAQIETVNMNLEESPEALEERLRKSPALRRSLAATLAKLESQTVV